MKYTVKIGRDNNLYGLDKDLFEAGETVEFWFMVASDTDYTITSEQVKLIPGNVDNGAWHWSFIMPERDVIVNISSRNTMTALPDPKGWNRFRKSTGMRSASARNAVQKWKKGRSTVMNAGGNSDDENSRYTDD